MAKIKMDVSEYEALKKNIQLLEESNKREDALNKEILNLQNEKIEVMKQNEKMVTIVKKTKNYSVIKQIVNNNTLLNEFSKAKTNYTIHYHNNCIDDMINCIHTFINNCFEIENYPKFVTNDESITYKGLDEITEQIREQIIKEFDDNIKKSLDLIPILKKENKELKNIQKQYNELQNSLIDIDKTTEDIIFNLKENIRELRDDIHISERENTSLKKQLIKIEQNFIEVRDEIPFMNIFNFKSIKKKLLKILNL